MLKVLAPIFVDDTIDVESNNTNDLIQHGFSSLFPIYSPPFFLQTIYHNFFVDFIFDILQKNNKKIQHGASPLLPANVQSTFLPRPRRLSLSQCLHSYGMEYFSIVWNSMKWYCRSPPFFRGREDCLFLNVFTPLGKDKEAG